jgi:hypothetical protein
MAHHRLHHAEDAKKRLDRASTWIKHAQQTRPDDR